MTGKIDDGGSAFPSDEIVYVSVGTDGLSQGVRSPLPGMSLRDYFAGQALLSCGSFWGDVETRRTFAKRAYLMADEMIARRKVGAA